MTMNEFKPIRIDFRVTDYPFRPQTRTMWLSESEFLNWKPFFKWLSEVIADSPMYNWFKSASSLRKWSDDHGRCIIRMDLVRNYFHAFYNMELPSEAEPYIAKLIDEYNVYGDKLEDFEIYRMTKIEL